MERRSHTMIRDDPISFALLTARPAANWRKFSTICTVRFNDDDENDDVDAVTTVEPITE